ncbi:hypothetical protein KSP40_PGU002628 [Platanthera guangdongensis]|uniref:Uncharacterized protein n=1 Tax=Platanthera guangdongensis TaxID=2320717 RepID=A0ABR2N0Q6_9ASPA
MQSGKKMATDVSASAKAGMEKAAATAQEKVEKMATMDPMAKERAEMKKEERKREAEMKKQTTQHDSAARKEIEARHAGVGGLSVPGTGPGGPTGGVTDLNPEGVHPAAGTGTNPAGHETGGRLI